MSCLRPLGSLQDVYCLTTESATTTIYNGNNSETDRAQHSSTKLMLRIDFCVEPEIIFQEHERKMFLPQHEAELARAVVASAKLVTPAISVALLWLTDVGEAVQTHYSNTRGEIIA